MKINKVHCLFEQSGTFKNQFKALGIPAEDYDILNDFSETDHVIDLFGEIEKAYDGKPSQIIEYEDTSFKKYKFTLEDDKISKIECELTFISDYKIVHVSFRLYSYVQKSE